MVVDIFVILVFFDSSRQFPVQFLLLFALFPCVFSIFLFLKGCALLPTVPVGNLHIELLPASLLKSPNHGAKKSQDKNGKFSKHVRFVLYLFFFFFSFFFLGGGGSGPGFGGELTPGSEQSEQRDKHSKKRRPKREQLS